MNYKYFLLTVTFLFLLFSFSVSAKESKAIDFKYFKAAFSDSRNTSLLQNTLTLRNDFSIFQKPWRVGSTQERIFSVFDKDRFVKFKVKVYYMDENKFKLWFEPNEPKTKYLFSKAANSISVSTESGCEAYYYDYEGTYVYCNQICSSSEFECFSSPPPLTYIYNAFVPSIGAMCASCSFKQKSINEYKASCEDPYCCNDVTETYCNPNTKYGQLVYTTGLITGVIIFKPVADKVYYCAYQNLLPKDGCGNSCSAGWKCQDSTHKGYQNSDCGWNSIEYCSNGCSNGSCIQSSCIAGWKCKDGSTKAYQNSDCSWSSVTYCSNGCSNGECIQNIACNKSADCGSPYYGNPFCKNNNVTKNYNYFICNNAGTPSASCSSSIFEETIEACGTKQCVNGACASTGKCSKNNDCGTDGYIGNKFCKNGSVYQQYKSYKCNNAGQGNASCSSSTEDKFVQQCDYGCENGKCKALLAQCTSGECCDIAAGKYKPKTDVCSTSFNYYCSENKAMKQEDKKYCLGNNSGCNGSTVSSSSLIENCSGNQICSDGECIKQEGSLPQSDPTATANILMILACPKDLCPNGKPITHNLGIGWFEDLANQLEDYYKTLSYDTEKLNVAVYPEWVMLPKNEGEYDDCSDPLLCNNSRWQEAKDAKAILENSYDLGGYGAFIVMDPTDIIADPDKWKNNGGHFYGVTFGNKIAVMPTYYSASGDKKTKELKVLAHETFHLLSHIKNKNFNEMQLHDNHNGSPYCLMGPGVPYNNNTYDFPAVKPWLDPVDAEFIGFSVAQLLTVPDLLPTFIGLNPIDESPMGKSIAGRQKKFNTQGKEFYLEYRLDEIPGLEGSHQKAVLIWGNFIVNPGKNSTPYLSKVFHQSDLLPLGGFGSPIGINIHIDPTTNVAFAFTYLDNSTAGLFVSNALSELFGLNPPSGDNYSVWINNCLFADSKYNMRVVGSSGDAVFEGIIESDSNGCFDEPITWSAEEDPNSEAENYVLALETSDGWTALKTFSLAHLDGVPKWESLVSKKRTGYYVPNDGVITKLNAALNPLKISIETFGNINSKYYKYEIDITAVKEEYKATNPATEYKLIYSYGEPYLYKKDKGYWTELKSDQLMAEDSGKTIEFYVPKQLLGNPEKIAITAKTYYQNQCVLKSCSETLADTFPKEIEITDTDKPLISLQTEKFEYRLQETIKLKGEGLKGNTTFDYKFVDNLSDETLCEGTVKSNSSGEINKKTCKIAQDETLYGTYKIYWEDVFVGYFNIVKESEME